MDNKDMPAMPLEKIMNDRLRDACVDFTGLTKREHFAALAMQGALSDFEYHGEMDHEKVAKDAVKQADALLKALEES